MKIASIALAGCALAVAGCAGGRAFSPGSSGGGGSRTFAPIPDTEPDLGSPSDSIGSGSSGSSTLFKGGPSFRGPEAFRDDLPLRSPRISSRWSQPGKPPPTGRPRAESLEAPISTNDRTSLLDDPTWSRVYRSTDRRAIETLQLGSGRQRIAILGSLHGDETQSVALVEELARHLKTHPETMRRSSVLLVKTPNPDGWYGRTPYNIHGVDLNRNFPSNNWKNLPNTRSGSNAASEAETRVVIRLLSDFRPTLLVHLKDGRDQSVVNREGNAKKVSEQIARLVNGRSVEGLGAKTSGSVENYAATDLKCPSVTLLLAREASPQAAWSKNRDGLLSLFGPVSQPMRDETKPLDLETDPFAEPPIRGSSLRNNSRSSNQPVNVSGTRRRSSSLPDFPAPVPEHGYLELPAP